ncbi:hypothetical protein CDAR_501401 [Caerostris darwini]|uniref:C2H2-type domain-containing protein n=1 Tax=Caerostris darwini TaxID=1538125 RepID=A0AAV4PVB4_9ARAC|nr:hypothetical protein CDAR_501401 [Caerostris darwini]
MKPKPKLRIARKMAEVKAAEKAEEEKRFHEFELVKLRVKLEAQRFVLLLANVNIAPDVQPNLHLKKLLPDFNPKEDEISSFRKLGQPPRKTERPAFQRSMLVLLRDAPGVTRGGGYSFKEVWNDISSLTKNTEKYWTLCYFISEDSPHYRNHLREHITIEPYQCPVCYKCFTSKDIFEEMLSDISNSKKKTYQMYT